MGTSNWQHISYCIGILRRLMPKSFLDVGAGFGRWGLLAREFLDVWQDREPKELWQVRIDGIEAFEGCLTAVHEYIYDEVHVGDAVEVLPRLGKYEMVFLGDVIEHQTKERGRELLRRALEHATGSTIVAIPIGDQWVQGVRSDGNPFSPHRSAWYLEDFDEYPEARRELFSDFRGWLYAVMEFPS